MSVLHKLASALERSDEVPNQLLAKEIAAAGNKDAVKELVDNLSNRDKAIQNDCIKVLYEIGGLKPDLIAPYVDNFLNLLNSGNNRLVWGGMTALGTIASKQAVAIWKHIDRVIDATDYGSVITQDWGVRVLAAVLAQDKIYEQHILSFLKTVLQNCPPKDLPRHAESVIPAVNPANRADILAILESRQSSLKASQVKRLAQVIRKMNAL